MRHRNEGRTADARPQPGQLLTKRTVQDELAEVRRAAACMW